MSETNVRVVGSGFTTFNYKGAPLAWLESVQDSGQAPLGGDRGPVEAIFSLGDKHPREIVTTRVLDAGTLVMSLRELWSANVWEQLAGLEGTKDIIQVYERLANEPSSVTCQMIIRPPNGMPPRGKVYHGCVITAIDDRDSITVSGMSVAKGITVAYTHTTPL